MRHFGGFGLALFCAAGLFGQAGGYGGRSPVVSSGFGHVFSPARGSISGLPGGGHSRANAVAPVYSYPVYVGGYGYLGAMPMLTATRATRRMATARITLVARHRNRLRSPT